METIKYDIGLLKDAVSEIRGERKTFEAELESKRLRVDEIKKEIEIRNESLIVLNHYTVEFLRSITDEYSSLIRSALRMLGKDYNFKIIFDTEKKKPTCEFLIRSKNRKQWIEPRDSVGEGIIDVIGLASLLITVKLVGNVNFVALDEPLAQLSRAGYSKYMARFLESCAKNDLQFLIITHNSLLVKQNKRTFSFDRLMQQVGEG